MNIDELINAMESQAAQEAALKDYDEQRARAEALRGTNYAQLGSQMGNVGGSYVGLLADLVANSKGRQLDREVSAPRRAAREGLAAAKAKAQGLLERRKFETEERDYKYKADKFDYEQRTKAQERADKLAERKEFPAVRKSDGEPVYLVSDGRGGYYEGDKKVNIANYQQEFKPGTGTGTLSGSSLRTGLEKLGKRIEEAAPVIRQVKNIDAVLAPYATGGAKEGQDVPGMGFWEGGRDVFGAGIRFLGSREGREVFQNISAFVSDILKEKAGTAQTFQETRNILWGLGLDKSVEEEVFLKYWPKIRAAVQKDLENIKRSTHGDVMSEYYALGNNKPTIFETEFSTQTFPEFDSDATGLDIITGKDKQPSADPFAGFSATEVK